MQFTDASIDHIRRQAIANNTDDNIRIFIVFGKFCFQSLCIFIFAILYGAVAIVDDSTLDDVGACANGGMQLL